VTERPTFVAREGELERLDHFLDRALAGPGLVCFVTGEAGSGKTALLGEFTQRAQKRHRDLVVAIGQGDAQTGAGDPYLPFRDMLGQLTGDVDAKLAEGAITQENATRLRKLLSLSGQALLEVGPDLIGIFVPGAGLVTRLGAFAVGKAGWLEKLERRARQSAEGAVPGGGGIDQAQIFEQYANVLSALAAKQPLLLVLDDLQWADAASLELLFRLGRRVGGSRILLVGTYRPDEVALGRPSSSSGHVERHPLEKVLAEFKRIYGDVWLDLDRAREAEGQRFVDAFLDTEPNRLGEAFRRALCHHTGGHPLFTIELLRAMQERGDLVRDAQARWVEGPSLDWGALPARVDGVIEERLGRLEGEMQQALEVASVEGEDFIAEVVAHVQAADPRHLIRRLSGELDRRHRLVSAQGTRRLEGQRLSLYRFMHNLFQAYLYKSLDDVERAYLHEDVGSALEDLYGEGADEIAVQLAWHFAEAGVAEKAIPYLQRAGEQAAARFANDEAVAYFSRALELTEERDIARRYALLLAREEVYDLQGERGAQQQDLEALEALVDAQAGDGLQVARQRAEVALRRANYAEITCDYPAAIVSAQAAIDLAGMDQDADHESLRLQATGHLIWGRVLRHQGDYDAAAPLLERALALAQPVGLRSLEADALRNLGLVCLNQGNYAEAGMFFEQALPILQESGDRRGEGLVLSNLGILAWEQGDHAGARAYLDSVQRIYHEIGFRQGEGTVLGNLGGISAERHEYREAMTHLERALLVFREVGDRQNEGTMLGNLGAVFSDLGDNEGARTCYEEALEICREIGDRPGEGITLVNLGLLFHRLGDDASAEQRSQQGLRIVRDIGDRFHEGYALTFLGHALAGLGHLDEATAAYQQAVGLRRELGLPGLTAEPLAGLAELSLAREDLSQACACVEEILSYLETGALEATDDPLRVSLVCYRVLLAKGDPRAPEILATAHALLQERAARIDDENLRRSFMERVPSHREIVRAFATR
jgi:adenylate cyclase